MAKIKEAIEDFKPDSRLVDERGPTLERIAKARGEVVVGKGRKVVTVRDAPLERMWASEKFAERDDSAANQRRYDALTKYRIHWFHAGMAGRMQSLDINQVFSDDINRFGLANTEKQVFHLQQYQRAVVTLGIRGSKVVEEIVCRETEPEMFGRAMGWNNRPQAVAVATQQLRDAADRLCSLWGM